MAIELPLAPRPSNARMEIVRAGSLIRSPLGGSTQMLNRLGDRYAMTVTIPALKNLACGGIWASRLDQARGTTVLYPLPGQLIRLGSNLSPGAPVVNGAAAGMALPVRGLTPGYDFVEGAFVSIVTGGHRYVHRITAPVVADGAGFVVLPILPMLRVVPADGATIEVTSPKIEGVIDGDIGTDTDRFGFNSFDTFTITENL